MATQEEPNIQVFIQNSKREIHESIAAIRQNLEMVDTGFEQSFAREPRDIQLTAYAAMGRTMTIIKQILGIIE